MRGRHVALLEPDPSLEVFVAIVGRAALVLTNDTGPRHVAVALDRPVVTLMGSTDPRHTAHLLERQRVLFEDVECRPCGEKICPIGDHRCLVRLSPERAVEAAGELLAAAS
jgi:heptosyltransferase-2